MQETSQPGISSQSRDRSPEINAGIMRCQKASQHGGRSGKQARSGDRIISAFRGNAETIHLLVLSRFIHSNWHPLRSKAL